MKRLTAAAVAALIAGVALVMDASAATAGWCC
jgi:hypothetical protein